jgi:predicted amidohydrolase YtcJ
MFTYNAAWTTFDEKDRGSLEKGKIADMVILSRNPLAMKPDELLNLKVERLLLNGKAYKEGQGILSLLARGILPGGSI